jgi:uncharacterized protein with HEPN domain
MTRDFGLYLEDIIDSIEKIERYTKDMDSESLRNDDKTLDAVIRNLEVIGEAVKNIPQGAKEAFPEIPWKRVSSMRDKLIHEYFGIRYDIISETIKNRLPELKSVIREMLCDLDKGLL